MEINEKMKTAIALSGGVDSAVAAKILIDEGHEIFGLFLRLWKHDSEDLSLIEARKVAQFLNIPFIEIDAVEEFRRVVVDYFVTEYKNLRTPNPCTLCNPEIKFRLLIEKAEELGCDYLATGHYARIEKTKQNNRTTEQQCICHSGLDPESTISDSCFCRNDISPQNMYSLYAGADSSKDQSYMLYRLSQDQLSKVIFPLGELTKQKVREMARNWNLPVAERKESQEICFLHHTDYRDFLRVELGDQYFKTGDIVDTNGNVIGRHEGLINYTIGQRKGIDQKQKNRETEEQKNKTPLYVVGFDLPDNRLIVGDDTDTFRKEMEVTDLHWAKPNNKFQISNIASNVQVKIRSQAKAVECLIQDLEGKTQNVTANSVRVVFAEKQRAVTPGQSAVFYNGDEVIGGGIIA